MKTQSILVNTPHTDEHGLPFVPTERGYWRSPVYVLTALAWVAFGLAIGIPIGLVISLL